MICWGDVKWSALFPFRHFPHIHCKVTRVWSKWSKLTVFFLCLLKDYHLVLIWLSSKLIYRCCLPLSQIVPNEYKSGLLFVCHLTVNSQLSMQTFYICPNERNSIYNWINKINDFNFTINIIIIINQQIIFASQNIKSFDTRQYSLWQKYKNAPSLKRVLILFVFTFIDFPQIYPSNFVYCVNISLIISNRIKPFDCFVCIGCKVLAFFIC